MQQEEGRAPRVRAVNFTPPPFWKANVVIWFRQVESQFRVKGVTSDDDMYDLIVGAIDASVLTQVSDLVIDPPATDKYKTLKERIIGCFGDSEEKKLQKLLRETTLGDKKPSHLLREMRELAGRKVSEELLKSLWLQQLPSSIQSVLSVSVDQQLSTLAALADKVREISEPQCINVVSNETEKSSCNNSDTIHELLLSRIEALAKQVESLSVRGRSTEQSSDRRPTTSRRMSKSRERKQNDGKWECRFHYRFGEKATRCESPCNNYERNKNKNQTAENSKAGR